MHIAYLCLEVNIIPVENNKLVEGDTNLTVEYVILLDPPRDMTRTH